MADVSKLDITSYSKYLPNQYKDSVNLHKLLGVFLEQVQDLEDANMEMGSVSTNIELAYGYQLDIIGKLVGVQRNNRTDEQLREAIYFQISVNSGNGTPEDVIQYLSYVTNATEVKYWEHYPASVILETNGTNIPDNIPTTLDNNTPAGVSVGGVITSETGLVFRGVELSDAFINYNPIPVAFPEVECGGLPPVTYQAGDVVLCGDGALCGDINSSNETIECGSSRAECVPSAHQGFYPVEETDSLARGIFPELNEIDENTTLGVFAEVFTKT